MSTEQTKDLIKVRLTGEAGPDDVIVNAVELVAFARALSRKLGSMQAKIDELMMEYCPDEITGEQLENWGKHQRPSPAPESGRS